MQQPDSRIHLGGANKPAPVTEVSPGRNWSGQNLWSKIAGALFEGTIALVLIFCCVGTLPPGVNESHYLPKAKFALDSSFASGGDLFLMSANSHWLATYAAGIMARIFDLATVAWIGRAASWIFLSFAWLQFCRSLHIPRVIRPIALLGWFLLNHYAHWSGEWFVGGFEAKAVAYPCVLMGLAYLVKDRWIAGWIWLGVAIAWHPVVGGWVAVTVVIAWLFAPNRRERLWSERFGIATGLAISCVGVIPALSGLVGSDREGNLSAAQIHAFYRLAHHMTPRTFAPERNWDAGILLSVFLLATCCYLRPAMKVAREQAMNRVLILAWSAVAICLVGWCIDRSVNFGLRPDIAARLLRFYFFRWADVVVPLAIVVVAAKWLTQLCFIAGSTQLSGVTKSGSYILAATMSGMAILGFLHWAQISKLNLPPAVMDSPDRHRDWLAACQWIRENTPADSLWLTPRDQQTFKWYAGRAEVVNWKDVPQDNASVIQWYRRIQACEPPKDKFGDLCGWTTDDLVALAQKYRFQWVLIDRAYQKDLPMFDKKYPILDDNSSFAVFFIGK